MCGKVIKTQKDLAKTKARRQGRVKLNKKVEVVALRLV